MLTVGQALGAAHSCISSLNPQDNLEVGAMIQGRTPKASGGEVAGPGLTARRWEAETHTRVLRQRLNPSAKHPLGWGSPSPTHPHWGPGVVGELGDVLCQAYLASDCCPCSCHGLAGPSQGILSHQGKDRGRTRAPPGAKQGLNVGVARGGGEPPVPSNHREQAEGKGLSVPGAACVLSPIILTTTPGGWDYSPILQKRKWRLRVLMGLAQGPTVR